MELPQFPFVNQLQSPTLDGRADENALYNCVPASIAACLRYTTGQLFEPDQLKDYAYGEAWANSGTAASAFVPFCAVHGVKLFAVEHGSAAEAVADAHALLAQGLPVIFTQQDDYSATPGMTHVCVWYRDAPGALTAMDPFGAKSLTYSDAIWADRLRSTELWSMQMAVPQDWPDDGTTLTAPNGVPVKAGFRQYIETHPWNPANWPIVAEYHVEQVQLHNTSLGPGQIQPCRDGILWYTVGRGVVYEPFLGLEIYAAYQQLAQLQSQVKALQAQLDASAQAALIAALQKKIDAVKAAVEQT